MIDYNTCRWCKWFDTVNGVCLNKSAFDIGDVFDFSPFTENGHLSEAIKEGFTGFKFAELETALIESKLSKKRREEIMKIFRQELESAFVNWTETIDESVSIALNNFNFEQGDGVYIKDPNEFSCKYFW